MGNPAVFRLPAVVLAVAAAAAFAWGCGGEPAVPRAERPLVLGYAQELQSLNPLVSTDQNANELIYYLLFTPLVRYDSTHHVAPGLAESWTLTDSSVVFRLRDDVRWHDGTPVTAADVAFTFERSKDPALASPLAAAYLGSVRDVQVLADHEVRFRFTEPHAQPLEDFFWPPVPSHILSAVPADEMARAPFNRAPVGNGPYRFVSWEVNQQLVFAANPDHAASLGGPPAISRVVYRIVPDATTLLAELLAGGVDVDGPLAPSDAARVERSGSTRLLSFPWRQFSYIGWNTRRRAFARADVRRALTMAVDRRMILATVLEGHGSLAVSVIPPWHMYAPPLEPLPYDPAAAKAALARAGWRDTDGDGIRDMDGVPFRFELLTNQRNPVYGDMAQIIQAQLRAVGVDAVPRLLEWQTVLSLHRSRDFDAVLTNWVLDNFRVDPRPLFHSDQIAVPGSANRSSYANPVADSLMEQGVRTTNDTRAATIWADFARIVQNDQPLTLLFWQHELAGVSDRLAGVRMDARGELVTIARWRWRDAGPTDNGVSDHR